MLKKLFLYLSLFGLMSAVNANNGVEYVPNELIVKIADGANYSDIITLRESVNATVKKTIEQLNLEVWNIQDELGFIDLIQTNRNIEYAEPNYIQRAIGMPDDARFNELWGMHNTGQSGGTTDADIDAVEAWDIFTGSHDVVVAVIDTGVDYNHVDLVDNRWVNVGETAGNGVDDDGNGFVDDVYGYDFRNNDGDHISGHSHGTHCSGTVGGVGNNSIGVAGVSHAVRIMAVKFLSDGGSGSTSDAIDAVVYAVDNGAQILSNSWGGGGFSKGLEDAISYANDHNVLFVAAAGNSNSNNDVNPFYPSNYEVPNVLAVAATDRNDAKASFSSYGLTSVDLGAPGVSTLSTVPGNDYGSKNGTSWVHWRMFLVQRLF
jgi:subtilisin family serine protease